MNPNATRGNRQDIEWTANDVAVAGSQGWNLFTPGGWSNEAEIQRDDDEARFDSDEAAVAFVRGNASRCPTCAKALRLVGAGAESAVSASEAQCLGGEATCRRGRGLRRGTASHATALDESRHCLRQALALAREANAPRLTLKILSAQKSADGAARHLERRITHTQRAENSCSQALA